MRVLEQRTSRVSVEARLNGRGPRCSVVLRRLDTDHQVAMDYFNLSSAKERSEFLGNSDVTSLPKDIYKEAGQLLQAVASEVVRSGDINKPDGQGKISLADPEPWPHPVDGFALVEGMVRTITRFVCLPEGGPLTVALWVLHAYAHDAAQVSPILSVCSPEKRCGKTTLLLVLTQLAPRALPGSNVTPAVLFRVVEQFHPTLLIDEADTFLSSREDGGELRGVLNSGHTRATAFVLRAVPVGKSYEARMFSTWCPRAVACIGDLPETLRDRSIKVRMRRRTTNESIERLRQDRPEEFLSLQRQCVRWVADNMDSIRSADPEVPVQFHDRAADNWRPLFAIADHIGGVWPVSARDAALALEGIGEERTSISELLLADIRELYRLRGVDRLPTTEILAELHAMEDRPWGEWGKTARAMSPRVLGAQLGKLQIHPGTHRKGSQVFKGYLRSDFQETWARYLGSHP